MAPTPPLTRRRLLAASASLAAGAALTNPAAAQPAPTSTPTTAPTTLPADLLWTDALTLGLHGRAFADVASPFDRLPARAKPIVREPVWNLSRHSAGLSVRFSTAADALYLRYSLLNPNLAMPHMPATGVSGLDLYTRPDPATPWSYLATFSPKSQSPTDRFTDLPPQPPGSAPRQYLAHLPLYNGVTSLQFAVRPPHTLSPLPAPASKSIVWYGTSITHGACASRPGLAFTNLLARRLDRTIHNFGFSGNGLTEPEVARFLAEINGALFILDTVANTPAPQLAERVPQVVRLLRDARPDMPILLLDQRPWAPRDLLPRLANSARDKSAALRSAFDQLTAAGVPRLHHRTGEDLLGSDHEATTDGSHPNDLGMMRFADTIEPTLRELLG